jgi:hypothetical protein
VTRRFRWAGVLATCCVAAVLALAGSASAKQIHTYTAAGTFDGSTSTAGAFTSSLGKLDIAQGTGNLYVQDGANVIQFNSAGTPVLFSGVPGKDYVSFTGSTTNADVEVDNNAASAGFGFYITGQNTSSSLKAFNFDGTIRGSFTNQSSGNCGIGVNPAGELYAASSQGEAASYTALGQPSFMPLDLLGGNQGHGACFPEFDSTGHGYLLQQFFLNPTPGLVRYGLPVALEGATAERQFTFSENENEQQNMAVDPSTDNVFGLSIGKNVTEYNSDGVPLFTFGSAVLSNAQGIAVNATTHTVYVTDRLAPPRVQMFTQDVGTTTVPTVTTGVANAAPTSAVINGTVNADGVATTTCNFEWGENVGYGRPAKTSNGTFTYAGGSVPCTEGGVFAGSSDNAVSAPLAGLTFGRLYHFRVNSTNANGIVSYGIDHTFRASGPPVLSKEVVSDVNTDAARFSADIDANGGDTTYSLELEECSPLCTPVPVPDGSLFSNIGVQHVTRVLEGLSAGTEYKLRLVAKNDAATVPGPEQTFVTFPVPSGTDPCANAQVRQQTGASQLFDCRAFELVSAGNAGGYDVESSLVPGQEPLAARPLAQDRALYSVHFGLIPGVAGNPTNFGRDPYVATRGATGWSTRYVGLPSNEMASSEPFGSEPVGSDAGLNAFAFGGPNICNPCFEDGSTNLPVRRADGTLVKGMAGSLEPGPANPAGEVRKYLSDDGSHLVFGTTAKLEPAGNEGGDVTVYERDLATDTTQVVSTLPGGATMTGPGIAALDVSSDGSRVLVGKLVATDGAGNEYFDLYMHVGSNPKSVQVVDSLSGALYVGMSSDGSEVYFTTPDQVASDTDASVDLYRADVGSSSASIQRVSTGAGAGDTNACNPAANLAGNNWNAVGGASVDSCGVVAIGGGGGVASNGSAYFFSPEVLDGPDGTLDEPNLYFAEPGSSPQFVTTLEPNNPAILDGVADSELRRTGDFQVTPDGGFAAFISTLSLTDYPNLGHTEVFRYDSLADVVDCASCPPTNASGTGDANLAPAGLNLTDDGRVFFTSEEPLVLRDTNGRRDAFEWEDGDIQIISTGKDPTDSAMLSVSADGLNAFFFTRETLVPEDENGATVKIYTARANGGYLYDPPSFPCAASDECHGPGTEPAPAPPINTGTGSESVTGPRACRRGFVRKHGTCVKRKKRRHHRRNRSATHHKGSGNR